MNNESPNGAVGIVFKDVDFVGTNIFINNRGPTIRVRECKLVVSF